MLSNEHSLRIDLLRFPMIVGVVFIHSYSSTVSFADVTTVVNNSSHHWGSFVRYIISRGIAETTVPLFFVLSGYLFFIGSERSWQWYIKKLSNRMRTLLIPFVFWNVTTFLLMLTLQNLPATRMFLSGRIVLGSDYSLMHNLNVAFGLTTPYPIAYQFWFIRDLLFMQVIVPLLMTAVGELIFVSLNGIAFYFWISGTNSPALDLHMVALLFFSAGAYLGHKNINLFGLDKFGWLVTGLCIAIIFADATIKNVYLHKFGIILGMSTALFLTKIVIQNAKLREFTLLLTKTSFFVFAVHEPLLTVIRKITYRVLLPESESIILLLYFTNAILTISVAIFLYHGLMISMPGFVAFIIGSRNTSLSGSRNTSLLMMNIKCNHKLV